MSYPEIERTNFREMQASKWSFSSIGIPSKERLAMNLSYTDVTAVLPSKSSSSILTDYRPEDSFLLVLHLTSLGRKYSSNPAYFLFLSNLVHRRHLPF